MRQHRFRDGAGRSWMPHAAVLEHDTGLLLFYILTRLSPLDTPLEYVVVAPTSARSMFGPTFSPYITDHGWTHLAGFQDGLYYMFGSGAKCEEQLVAVTGSDRWLSGPDTIILNESDMNYFFGRLTKAFRSIVKPTSGRPVNLDLNVDLSGKPIPPMKEPDYSPYEDGTIVYRVQNGKVLEGYGPGKILRRHKRISSSGDYEYTVEFLENGTDGYYHRELVPARDSFDCQLSGSDCYRATFDCGGLFKSGEPFLLRNDGYLYNKGNTVIIRLSKFQNKFTNNATVQTSSDTAEKT